jgi:hypothetical protein
MWLWDFNTSSINPKGMKKREGKRNRNRQEGGEAGGLHLN